MRRATKVLFFLLGLIVLAHTGLTFWFIFTQMPLHRAWAQSLGITGDLFYAAFYGMTAAATITALVGVGLIVRALSARRRDRKLTFADDEGSVQITEEAIASGIRVALADYPGVVESDVRLRLNNGRNQGLEAVVECGISEGANLEQHGQAIRARINRDLETLTGLSVRKLDVIFYNVRPRKHHSENRQVSS